MTTLSEVAKRAGVSIGSASRVFNQHPNVTSEIRQAVEKAAAEIGYERHKKKKHHMTPVHISRLLLLTLGMDRNVAGLQVIADLLGGARQRAEACGLDVLQSEVPQIQAVSSALKLGKIDAFALKAGLQGSASEWKNAPILLEIQKRNLPLVWMSGRPEGCSGDMCGTDDFAAGQLAARHLIERGHRRLAYLCPKPDHQLFMRREAGFMSEARHKGAQAVALVPDGSHAELPVKRVEGHSIVDDLLKRMYQMPKGERPTALFIPADNIAALAYRALAQRQIKVGSEISIIGCNNESEVCGTLFPTLTTIDILSAQIGARAIDQLFWRAGNPGVREEITVHITPVLIHGDSVKSL